MNIIIVGCGKVGLALTGRLSEEGHNITVIDINADKANHTSEEYDVMGITGNGSSISTLMEAGMENTDVFIAVTGSDELNLLCCMLAKKAGRCRAVARVRNPMYIHEFEFIKQQLEISTIINPELSTANEISKLLRFPVANKIDTFADGRVQLIKFELESTHGLSGITVREISEKMEKDVLICAVEHGHDVIIPDGSFVPQNGDIITLVASPQSAKRFFEKLNVKTKPVRNVIIVGGGTIAYYLTKELLKHGIDVKLIDNNFKRCEELSEMLPEANILCGDGTDRQFLLNEGITTAEAVVTLTNIDEENIILSLFSRKHSRAKVVTKINRLEYDDILEGLDVGSVIYPKYLTCDYIMQYVRALKSNSGSNIKTLYRILDDRVEALEFTVLKESEITKKPLSQLKLKRNLLICCITRDNKIIIPRGNDSIKVGDSVVVVSFERGLHDITDILL